jgi:sirohydrochlorin ferrochelatase
VRRSKGPAVILIGHGSRVPGSDRAMRRVARALRKDKQFRRVACAYLEFNTPSIADAIDQALAGGSQEVRLIPYFVHAGSHVVEHIPQIVREAVKRHSPKAKIKLCPYLGFHQNLVSVVKERLR